MQGQPNRTFVWDRYKPLHATFHKCSISLEPLTKQKHIFPTFFQNCRCTQKTLKRNVWDHILVAVCGYSTFPTAIHLWFQLNLFCQHSYIYILKFNFYNYCKQKSQTTWLMVEPVRIPLLPSPYLSNTGMLPKNVPLSKPDNSTPAAIGQISGTPLSLGNII